MTEETTQDTAATAFTSPNDRLVVVECCNQQEAAIPNPVRVKRGGLIYFVLVGATSATVDMTGVVGISSSDRVAKTLSRHDGHITVSFRVIDDAEIGDEHDYTVSIDDCVDDTGVRDDTTAFLISPTMIIAE